MAQAEAHLSGRIKYDVDATQVEEAVWMLDPVVRKFGDEALGVAHRRLTFMRAKNVYNGPVGSDELHYLDSPTKYDRNLATPRRDDPECEAWRRDLVASLRESYTYEGIVAAARGRGGAARPRPLDPSEDPRLAGVGSQLLNPCEQRGGNGDPNLCWGESSRGKLRAAQGAVGDKGGRSGRRRDYRRSLGGGRRLGPRLRFRWRTHSRQRNIHRWRRLWRV